ncbi:hypothetical protein HME7025_02475 [Aquirufa nivalisilvae]|uniref:SGNH/GDSL hydrolase family protein n=1 Tax=Aquirufa nivalisilvae TaxID=2516557 RepID=A0A2S2DY43_9BACT|nr:hypothetical protein HME7025_02475 [Aquirufa nivalisilvae]
MGSSRFQRGVDINLLKGALSKWNIMHLGLAGNTLAQTLYLANLFKELPGNKVVIIELTPYKRTFPESFKYAGAYLNIPNFLENYYRYISASRHDNFTLPILNYQEFYFWNTLTEIQNQLKVIFKGENNYKVIPIGFVPSSDANCNSVGSFLTTRDLSHYSSSGLNKTMWSKINNLLNQQKERDFKVIFVLPITSRREGEYIQEIPVFNKIPIDSKWQYDDVFLEQMAKPLNLADNNHLNVRGAYVYSQGLLKYIKSNEASWQ